MNPFYQRLKLIYHPLNCPRMFNILGLFNPKVNMEDKKKKWLSEEWNGWKYGWIKKYSPWEETDVLEVHEFYQNSTGVRTISVTTNCTPPGSGESATQEKLIDDLQGLANLLVDGIIFTMDELTEYNKTLSP